MAKVMTNRRLGVGRVVGEIAPAVVLAIGMVAAVNIAIPKLQASSLQPLASGAAWIVDSYTLVFACLLIPAGAMRGLPNARLRGGGDTITQLARPGAPP